MLRDNIISYSSKYNRFSKQEIIALVVLNSNLSNLDANHLQVSYFQAFEIICVSPHFLNLDIFKNDETKDR
jgi:hypothetical protein